MLPAFVAATLVLSYRIRFPEQVPETPIVGQLESGQPSWYNRRAITRPLHGLCSQHFVILVPVIVSALTALQLDAITRPATDILAKVIEMLPAIFRAGLLLLAVIVRFATMEARNLLGFAGFSAIVRNFVGFGGHVLLGLGDLRPRSATGQFRCRYRAQQRLAGCAPEALGARIVIVLLSGAMALRQMELATDIVYLAFGFIVGAVAVAVAVAVALAFGLRGRDSTAALLADWRQRTDKPGSKDSPE